MRRCIHFAQRRQARQGSLLCGLVLETVDQTCDPIANELSAEVDQQTEAHVSQSQIGQNLLLVDPLSLLDGLDLDDDLLLDHEVGFEGFVEADVIIPDRNRDLTLDPQPAEIWSRVVFGLSIG